MSASPSLARVVDRDEWLAARRTFLRREKELTRLRDAINAERRALPRLLIDKKYEFETPDGPATLLDLFDGRRQLLTYHFMWPLEGHEWCPVCAFWIDNMGHLAHLNARDTTLVIVCSAPQELITPFRRRMGWTVPWYTSKGDQFLDDFTLDLGTEDEQRPGVSAFLREGSDVYYSYSTYGRGSDLLNGTYNYLDLTPLGRQEEGLPHPMLWIRFHDRYGIE